MARGPGPLFTANYGIVRWDQKPVPPPAVHCQKYLRILITSNYLLLNVQAEWSKTLKFKNISLMSYALRKKRLNFQTYFFNSLELALDFPPVQLWAAVPQEITHVTSHTLLQNPCRAQFLWVYHGNFPRSYIKAGPSFYGHIYGNFLEDTMRHQFTCKNVKGKKSLWENKRKFPWKYNTVYCTKTRHLNSNV